MNELNNIKKIENKEISEIYKIFEEIYLKAPPILKDISNNSVDIDYTESLNEKIDFKKIDTKFKNGEYCSITNVMKDIREVFLNCYSFYGIGSDHTKKSLELEELLEEKISHLDGIYKLMAGVDLTFNLLNMERKRSSKLRYPKDCYDSVLLRSVAHCRPERLKKYRKISTTTLTSLTTDKDNAHHILEKILSWENDVYFNDVFNRYISSMWELPEIGNFVAILFKKLDLDIINQGEIERMFLMPKQSTTMGKIMTTLFMPVKKKKKFIGQVMPYKIWSEKLSKKVTDWCKVYHLKKQNKVIVMNSLGIHPDFWAVVSEKNPLIEKDYSELSYFVKVWLVKALCDYVTIKFKTINDIITNCNEKQCTIWKNELETEEYFFFDSIPDLRVYYYNIPYDEPSIEFLESVKTDTEEVKIESDLPMNGVSVAFRSIQNEKHFKLIADSVEGLRTFLDELDMEGTSVPENLISALKYFIVKIESKENHFIALNNDSKIKLFKDYESYPDRIQTDEDNVSLWEEKNSKSIAQDLAQNKEIILQKRPRKLIVTENVDESDESDEYFTEHDTKSISDFTDSEDEWGAMNQPKNKVKPLRTSSKLVELEKKLLEKEKMLKYDTNNLLDANQNNEYNGYTKTLVCSKNKDDKSFLEVKETKPITLDLAQNNKITLQKRTKKLVVRQDFESGKYYDSEEYFSEHDAKSISVFNDLEDEWGGISQPKNKIKPPRTSSKLLELKKQLKEKDKISKHKTKVFGTNTKGKSIKSVGLLKAQNEGNCSNNTNSFVNGRNKRLVNTNIIDNVRGLTEVVLIDSDKEENDILPDGLKQREIINLDEDMLNDCEIIDDTFETSISTCTENEIRKSNEQDNYKQIESAVISIKDDHQIIISDNVDDVQFISMIVRPPKSSPLNIKKRHLKTNLNRSLSPGSANRQTTPTNYNKHQATSSVIHKLSQKPTIRPANVHVPKGTEVPVVQTPQKRIGFHFNSIKRRSNGHLPKNTSTINVKCEVISKPNLDGEVKFYIRLPNGKEHPGPNELINQYLKQHNNQLPDYWLVPLSVEVAKQYGIN